MGGPFDSGQFFAMVALDSSGLHYTRPSSGTGSNPPNPGLPVVSEVEGTETATDRGRGDVVYPADYRRGREMRRKEQQYTHANSVCVEGRAAHLHRASRRDGWSHDFEDAAFPDCAMSLGRSRECPGYYSAPWQQVAILRQRTARAIAWLRANSAAQELTLDLRGPRNGMSLGGLEQVKQSKPALRSPTFLLPPTLDGAERLCAGACHPG